MYDFLNAFNDFESDDERRWAAKSDERELGAVMEVVISTTRSNIGRAFSTDVKVPAKLKDRVAA